MGDFKVFSSSDRLAASRIAAAFPCSAKRTGFLPALAVMSHTCASLHQDVFSQTVKKSEWNTGRTLQRNIMGTEREVDYIGERNLSVKHEGE